MKKFKFIPAIIAVLFTLAGAYAFTGGNKGQIKKSPVIYHYTSNSDDIVEMQKTSNWEIVEEPTGCGITGDLPCSKELEEESEVVLQNFLNNYSTGGALAAAADTRKN